MKNCASASLRSGFASAPALMAFPMCSICSRCIDARNSCVAAMPRRRASVSTHWSTHARNHRSAHARTALGSTEAQAFKRSLACFLYCSSSERDGSGLVSIRISFHCLPGVRTDQAERRFVPSRLRKWVGTALSADWMRPERSFYATAMGTSGRFAVSFARPATFQWERLRSLLQRLHSRP